MAELPKGGLVKGAMTNTNTWELRHLRSTWYMAIILVERTLLQVIPQFPPLTRDRTGGPRHHVFPSLEAEELLGRTFPVKVAGKTMGFCFFPLEFSLQFVLISFLSCTICLTQGFYPYEGLAYHCKTLSTCAAKNQFLSEFFF